MKEMNQKIARGNVYRCDFGKTKGSIQGGLRPCIVLSNNKNNMFSPTVNVIQLTSKTKNELPVHHVLKKEEYDFLDSDSITLCEQITTVNKSDLRFLGKIKEEDMRKTEKCILIQLGIK